MAWNRPHPPASPNPSSAGEGREFNSLPVRDPADHSAAIRPQSLTGHLTVFSSFNRGTVMTAHAPIRPTADAHADEVRATSATILRG